MAERVLLLLSRATQSHGQPQLLLTTNTFRPISSISALNVETQRDLFKTQDVAALASVNAKLRSSDVVDWVSARPRPVHHSGLSWHVGG